MNKLKFKHSEKIIFVFLILLMLFSRSFTGLYIFGYRIGELIIGFGILFAIVLSLSYFTKKSYKHILLNKYLVIVYTLFLISLFINNGSLFSLYTYKSSSYIWTASFLLVGIIFYDLLDKKYFQISLITIPFIVYILGTINFPNLIQNFFINYSDKFEFQKASDLLVVILVCLFTAKYSISDKKYYIFYFFSISGLFIPLFLFMSKGSLLAYTFYFLFEIILLLKFFKYNIRQLIVGVILGSLMFSFSTLNIWGDFTFTKPQNLFGLMENSSELTIADKFAELYRNKALDFEHPDKIIYIIDGRIYSNDITSNWRLQIWQDVYFDLLNKDQFLFGYGYNEIIPAMDDVERRGTDGTNEHVHNYFVNIFARGGLVQLLLFIYAYFMILTKSFEKNYKLYAFQFVITILLVSFFDSSMESVRFPLIFYFFAGAYLHKFNKRENIFNGL